MKELYPRYQAPQRSAVRAGVVDPSYGERYIWTQEAVDAQDPGEARVA